MSPLIQSVTTHVRALMNMHSGPLFLEENQSILDFMNAQVHQRSLLAKRRAEVLGENIFMNGSDGMPGIVLRSKRRRMGEVGDCLDADGSDFGHGGDIAQTGFAVLENGG